MPGLIQWIIPSPPDRPSFDRMVRLTRDNRATFKTLFGPRQQVYRSEFAFDVWRREHNGVAFWLLTARDKGTSIEVEGNPTLDDVVSFLERLDQQIIMADDAAPK